MLISMNLQFIGKTFENKSHIVFGLHAYLLSKYALNMSVFYVLLPTIKILPDSTTSKGHRSSLRPMKVIFEERTLICILLKSGVVF